MSSLSRTALLTGLALVVVALVTVSLVGITGVVADDTPTPEEMSLNFENQQLEDREVVVENVDTNGEAAGLIIAYEDGDDTIISGVRPGGPGEWDGDDVSVQLVDTNNVPGEFTALIFPLEEMSTLRYYAGKPLSNDTLDAVQSEASADISGDEPDSQASNVDIGGQGQDATIMVGDDEDIEVDVENVGDESQSFEVDLFISDDLIDTVTTDTLAPAESETVTFENATGDRPVSGSTSRIDILTDDNGIGGSLLIESPPGQPEFSNLDIAGQGPVATINIGDNEDVSVDVENVGDEAGSFNVNLTFYEDIDDDIIAHEVETETNTLEPNESQSLTFEGVTGGLDADDYNVRVSAVQGSTSGLLTVASDAESDLSDLDIAGQGEDATIDEGDNEDISVTVTNLGNDPGSFDVDLQLPGLSATESTGEIPGGESETVTFEGVTGHLSDGTHELQLSTDDDSISGTVTVEEVVNTTLSNLDIAGQGPSATITEGDDEDISVDVTNEADETASYDVDLIVGSVAETVSTSELAPDATETVTFESVTGGLASADFTVTTATDDDTESGALSVQSPAASSLSVLDIAGQGDDATITEGTNEDISANVTNDGGQGSTFDVMLSIGDAVDETVSTGTIRAGETETVTFESVTGALDPDGYTVTLSTDDDSTTGDLTVEPGEATISNLDIAGQDDDATITEGDDEDVSVAVTNDGETTQSFTLELDIDGETWTEDSDDLGSGETDTVTFAGVTADLDPNDYTVTVSTPGDEVTGALTVMADAPSELSELDIAGQNEEATIAAGDDEDVSVVVENTGTGDTPVTFDVTLSIGEDVSVTETSDGIRGGQTDTMTFAAVTGDLDAAATPYDVSVSTDDDEVSGSLTVQTPATSSLSELDIAGQGTEATITEGDDESVSINVTNVGEATDSFAVTLGLDGETQTEVTDSLGATESETLTFEDVTGDLDAAENPYDVTVSTDDDEVSGTLTVTAPGESSLSALTIAAQGDDATIVEGEDEDVAVNVTNVGGSTETFAVTLALDGQSWTENTDSLGAGESETVTFERVTGDLDGVDTPYDVTLSTDDDELSGSLTVESPPESPTSVLSNIDIAGQGADGTVVEGEDENIAVNVTNVGDESGSFSVSLDIVSQVAETKTTDTLASGETETVVFENATAPLSANDAAYAVAIDTDDDEISGTVTVQEPPEPSLAELNIAGQGDNATIGVSSNEDVAVTVTNVGGAASSFTLTLEIGDTITETVETGELAGGESETVDFEDVTGELEIDTYAVVVSTETDEVTGQLTIQEQAPAASTLTNLDIAGQGEVANVTGGENVDVSVTVTNVGDLSGSFEVTLSIGDAVTQTIETDTLTSGESETVAFETDSLAPGTYDVNVSTADDTLEGNLTVLGPPPVAGDAPPTQAGFDDGLYRDVMGTGQLTIFDVQAFFNVFETSVVQENAAFFDFDGSGEITISDVQQLFFDLTEAGE